MKKFILSAFTATSLLLSSSPIFAAPLTISLGIPQEQTFTEKNKSGSKIEADRLKINLRNIGFKGAFIVAFLDGKQISTKEALNLQNKLKENE